MCFLFSFCCGFFENLIVSKVVLMISVRACVCVCVCVCVHLQVHVLACSCMYTFFFFLLLFFYNCIVPMEFLFREIRVAFLGES